MGFMKARFLMLAFAACSASAQITELDKVNRAQKREVIPSLPAAIHADTERLAFHVSALSAKGLLTQQITDAVKNILKINEGGTVVKLRAFVASSGDLRRVQSVVAEMFSERFKPLPALTVVQVGQVPLPGAQVVMESMSISKKVVNPNGLVFVSGEAVGGPEDIAKPAAELVARSTAQIRKIVEANRSGGMDVLTLTCFTSSLDGYAEMRKNAAALFPKAAFNFVQTQRSPDQPIAQCEAIARLRTPPKLPIEVVSGGEDGSMPKSARAVLVGAGRVTMSSAQLAFQSEPADIRLAFTRLKGTLEQSGTSISNVFVANLYSLTRGMLDRAQNLRFEFFDPARPPAGAGVSVEGLPSLDASFAMDVIASPTR
jgi:enamine deaminase RidA (YjgF/YER057c/UK114 family)